MKLKNHAELKYRYSVLLTAIITETNWTLVHYRPGHLTNI